MPSRSLTVERIRAPSSFEEFRANYVHANRPVVVTGVVDQWPAVTKWTQDYLKQVGGDSIVTVRFDADGDQMNYYQSAGFKDRQVKFADFVNGLEASPPDTRYCIVDFPLARISPALLDDVLDPPFTGDGLIQYRHVFVARDTYSPPHFHPWHQTFLCQIVGRKQLTLYSPDHYRGLYPGSWWSRLFAISQVDDRAPDLRRFPRFAAARPLHVDLEAGELLFIPIHWWHSVLTEGLGIGVSYSWAAGGVRAYQFPFPGLAVLARRACRFQGLRRRLVKIKHRLPFNRS